MSRANLPGIFVFGKLLASGRAGRLVHNCLAVKKFDASTSCVFLSDSEREARSQALEAHYLYSYLKLSTGSSFDARVAGTVPKIMPTKDETKIATIADKPEIGIRYSVRKRTE